MRKPSDSDILWRSDGPKNLANDKFIGGERVRLMVLLAALGMTACGKPVAQNGMPDAAVAEGIPSAMPAAYNEFERPDFRARFASDFSRKLEITQGSDHFFFRMDYQWKLEAALKQAGQGGEVPDSVFRQTNEAVLGQGLQKLYGEWAHKTLSEKNPQLYRGPYVQQLYRHYRYLRYLEVLPEQPERRGVGDLDKLIKGWFERDQKVWQWSANSPFFGIKKEADSAGPLEKPLMPFVHQLTDEFVQQCPNRASDEFKYYHLSKIQSSVLDALLPAMYFEAIKQRYDRAGLSFQESGFDPIKFESELKDGLRRRSEFFGRFGVNYASSPVDRRIMEIVSAKFREISRLEHPLEVYRVTK